MKSSKALFLDRDGVINIDKNFVYKIEDFEFIDGIFEICKFFQDRGFKIFVITNQSGIGRGYYSEEEFLKLTNWMIEQFKNESVIIDKVYYCPHHPTKARGEYKIKCECRKPGAGMILTAKEEFNLNLEKSILIGDKERDILSGESAGIGTNILFDGSEDKISISKLKAKELLNEY